MNISQTKRTAVNVTTGIMSLLLPQNGAVAEPVRYGNGEPPPPLLAVASSVDPQNGNVAPGEATKRPKNPRVNTAKPYATKTLRGSSDDVEDGSLPHVTELDSDETSGEYEALENDTRELITRLLVEYAGLEKPQWKQSKALKTMKRVVGGLLEKHRYTYNGMLSKLSQADGDHNVQLVGEVAKSLFSDGTTNWGRIASLVAFGAVVAKFMEEKGRGDNVVKVGREISSYLLVEQRDWLIKNNAWEGFVEFFRVPSPESTVRNTLMACAGVFGLGATLALLTR